MKFFSAALAVLAAGSAVAAPVDSRSEPCPCEGSGSPSLPPVSLPTVSVPSASIPPISLPTPCTTLSSPPGQITGAPGGGDSVSVVVGALVEVVVDVEAKVKAELGLIGKSPSPGQN
jgi:hypothetical protein